MRSFIRPRKKKLLDNMSLMWLIFIVLMALGLVIFSIMLHYKSSFYIKMLDNLGRENSLETKTLQKLNKRIALIVAQGKIYQEVNSSNIALKESMQNLFDLIPDQITLTRVVMKKESLYLKGYTQSKAAYRLLLEPPLKSVFASSRVRFMTDARGCLMFESFNSVEDSIPEQPDGNQSEQ